MARLPPKFANAQDGTESSEIASNIDSLSLASTSLLSMIFGVFLQVGQPLVKHSLWDNEPDNHLSIHPIWKLWPHGSTRRRSPSTNCSRHITHFSSNTSSTSVDFSFASTWLLSADLVVGIRLSSRFSGVDIQLHPQWVGSPWGTAKSRKRPCYSI